MTKRAKAITRTMAPASTRTSPTMRTGVGQSSRTCQWVSPHGMRPATTAGAATKKTALPAAAFHLRMLASCQDQRPCKRAGWKVKTRERGHPRPPQSDQELHQWPLRDHPRDPWHDDLSGREGTLLKPTDQ